MTTLYYTRDVPWQAAALTLGLVLACILRLPLESGANASVPLQVTGDSGLRTQESTLHSSYLSTYQASTIDMVKESPSSDPSGPYYYPGVLPLPLVVPKALRFLLFVCLLVCWFEVEENLGGCGNLASHSGDVHTINPRRAVGSARKSSCRPLTRFSRSRPVMTVKRTSRTPAEANQAGLFLSPREWL